MKNYKTAVFRIGDAVGPDYVCSGCGLAGHRLWRESNTMLCHIDLLCAVCAEVAQKKQIEEYAEFHRAHDSGIGNLVPARATPEGDNFWGHTSGDVAWWYRLPQYQDAARELARVRIERDFFQQQANYFAEEYLTQSRRAGKAERETCELQTLGASDGRRHLGLLYKALVKIRDHSERERKTDGGWCEAFSDVRGIASEALHELVGRRR